MRKRPRRAGKSSLAHARLHVKLVDGKPNVEWEPNTDRWTGADIQAVVRGAEGLDGPWEDVPEEGGSPGTARPTLRFFKVVVEVP